MLVCSTPSPARRLGRCSLVVAFLVSFICQIPLQAQAETPLTLDSDTPQEVSALANTTAGGDSLALRRHVSRHVRGTAQNKALALAVSQLETQAKLALGQNVRLRSSLVWGESIRGGLSLVVPLHQGVHSATFLQPAIHLWQGKDTTPKLDKKDHRRDFSLGLVRRWFVDESRSTRLGLGGFFDHGTHQHQRLGLTGDLRHRQTTLTAQAYLPLTKQRTGFDQQQETTLKGYALGLEQQLNGRLSAEANFVHWQVRSEAGTAIASDTGNSADLALRYRLTPTLSLQVGYERHADFVNADKSAQLGIEFQLPAKPIASSESAPTLDLWSPVEREGRILVSRTKTQDTFEGLTISDDTGTIAQPAFVLPPYTSVQLLNASGAFLSERSAILRPAKQTREQITFRIVFDKVPHSFAYQLLLEGEAKIPDDYTVAGLFLNDARLPSAEHFVIPASDEETQLDVVFNIVGTEDAPQKRVVLVLRPIHADSIGSTAAVSRLDIAPQAVRAHMTLAAKGNPSKTTKAIAFRFTIVEKHLSGISNPVAVTGAQRHRLNGKKHNGNAPATPLPVAVTIEAHAQYLNLGADQTVGGGDDTALEFPAALQALEAHLRLVASKGADLQDSLKISQLTRLQDNCYEMVLQPSSDRLSFSTRFQVAAHQVRHDGEQVLLELDPFPLQESVEALFGNEVTPLLMRPDKAEVTLILLTPEANAALLEFENYTRDYGHYVTPQEPAKGDAPVILRIPFIISYDQPPAEDFKHDYIVPIHIKKHRGIFGRAEIGKDLRAVKDHVVVNIVGDGISALFTSEFPIELLADNDPNEPHELFFVRFGKLPRGFTAHQREKGYFIEPQGITPPSVSLSATAGAQEPASGTSNIVATVSLFARHPEAVEVPLKIGTRYDSAQSGKDYEDQRRVTLTIPAGQLSASHTIKVKADNLDEDTEFITITIARNKTSKFFVPLDAVGSVVATITDSPEDTVANTPETTQLADD